MIWIPTRRDIAAMVLIYKLHFATIEQMATAVFNNWNVSQRRLACLEENGYVVSFPLLQGQQGQPTKVYYLNHRMRKRLAEILGSSLDPRNIVKAPPENVALSRHTLELNRILVAFLVATRERQYHFEFIPEYAAGTVGNGRILDDEVQDPANAHRRLRFRRDAVCCLGTERGKALFEVEYDRGLEAIEGAVHRKVTVGKKVAAFLQSLKERRFERYAGAAFFHHLFKTSRLLLITSSAGRAERIAALCEGIGTQGLVYITHNELVSAATVLDGIWHVPGSGGTAMRKLVNDHE